MVVTVLRHDGFTRSRRIARPGAIVRLGMLVSLIFCSITLMVLERVDQPQLRALRAAGFQAIAPVLELASEPALLVQRLRRQMNGYLDLFAEIDRLRVENQQLKQWQARAEQLEMDTREFRKLLLAVDDSSYAFATGRVIADGRSPFVRTALINLGRAQGVTNGYAVVNAEGFIGRVVETAQHSARVLLLTDINSRIPVSIGIDGVRAIMRGDGDNRPVIDYLPSDKSIAVGDAVVTSGQDGLLPHGLAIGRIIKIDNTFRVVPRVDLDQVDFASVLFYAAPGLELANMTAAPPDGEAVIARAH